MTVRTSSNAPVRVRFAPSPSGAMHLGSAFVAVANAAFARSTGGDLLLRIDDTDASRSHEQDTLDLLRLLRWLGVEWDEGPVHQRHRHAQYRHALDELHARGNAYPCFCGTARIAELHDAQRRAGEPPRYDGRCRRLDAADVDRAIASGAPHVLRFAVPEGRDVAFDDLVHGRVVMPAGSFGDPVLCRSDGSAGYLLASVVDDVGYGITHVVRGEDHLSNTARQILLFEALGVDELPVFAHLPLLREGDGRKLSKRDPLGTLDEMVDEGFLPRTVRRYIAELLGQGATDLLPPDAPAPQLLWDRVPTGAPRVDRTRLESLGREDMAQLDTWMLLEGMGVPSTPERAPLVAELAAASPSLVALRGELRLVFDGPGAGDLPHVLRIVAPERAELDAADRALELAADLLRLELQGGPGAGTDAIWSGPFLARLKASGSERGLRTREVLRPLRVALTGTTGGPSLELLLTAVGAHEALRRVHLARFIIGELRTGGGNEPFDG